MLLLLLAIVATSPEPDPAAVDRGRAAVHAPWNPPFWSPRAYEEAWKRWGVAEKPADYAAAFRLRYGLHEPPYPNDGLPLGLHRTRGLIGLGSGVGNDCYVCHAGTVAGQTILGLGNASLDLQSLYEDLYAADGLEPTTPLPVSRVRGTNEASNFAVYLMQFREKDLTPRLPTKYAIQSNLCEDVPAWWHLRKKSTLYAMGIADSRSVRTLMPFLLIPTNSARFIKDREPAFADIHAYLQSLRPPKYPYPIDSALAERGRVLFEQKCTRCHGTYGPDGSYPNKIVAFDVIGTDRTFAESFAADAVEHYLGSWFAREASPDGASYHGLHGEGYQAPPLDGVWATAPYFHNGSVPTVHDVLKSSDRPRVFTRTYRGDEAEYDRDKLGVRVQSVGKVSPDSPPHERRKVYDTTEPGRGNGGHTFGDALSDEERAAVVEYLKTL